MITFENLNLIQLRKIVKEYNLHIPKYYKMKKDDLIIEMHKHIKIEGDMIKAVMTPFEKKAPTKTKKKLEKEAEKKKALFESNIKKVEEKKEEPEEEPEEMGLRRARNQKKRPERRDRSQVEKKPSPNKERRVE